MSIKTNTTKLQELLQQANNLPTAGELAPKLQSKTVSPTTSKQTITPDANYDALSSVIVNAMPTATQATPTISINDSGLITASSTQSAGYVVAGTKSATKQLTTKSATTITPTTSEQTAVASGVYTTGAIKVAAIPSNYEDVTEETNTYTNLLPTLENVINSLPDAGSGGGGNSDGSVITAEATPTSNSLSISFNIGTNVQPTAFSLMSQKNITLATTRYVSSIDYKDEAISGVYVYKSGSTSMATIQAVNSTSYTWEVENNTLTITSSGATTGGYFMNGITYDLIYTTNEKVTASGGGSTTEQATPVISVNTNTGLITATAGDKSATQQLTVQAAKTITPSSSSQTAVASGVYTTGAVTVSAVPTETLNATENKTYTPTSGKFFSSVTVNVPSSDSGGTGDSGSGYTVWERCEIETSSGPAYSMEFGNSTSTSNTISTWNDTGKRIIYKTYTFNENTGIITLSDPLSTSQSSSADQLSNYEEYPYWYGDKSSGTTNNTVYKFTNITSSGSSFSKTYTWYYDEAIITEGSQSKGDFIEYIADANSSAYPDNGIKNGYWYVKVASGNGEDTGSTSSKLQSKAVIPTESVQTIKPDSGYDGLSQVTVSAISSTYIGSGVTTQNYYTGSTTPASSLGSNGDLYLMI